METPCSCCGSLKYSHHRCVQRCCNEKGDIVCEICYQFMVLLILHHTLPILANGVGNYSLPVFVLRTSGIIILIYNMLRGLTTLVIRRRQLASNASTSSFSFDEGAGPTPWQHQPHIGRVN